MSKIALLFAGQGAQVVGMGRDLAEKYPGAKGWFDRANEILGYDLAAVCFNGPEADLTKTENAQPGIFLVSWIAFQLLQEKLPALGFDATAGLSLGEFTALAAAGVMSFEDGLRVVRERGKFMQEACEVTKGTMAAIIGLDEAPTREEIPFLIGQPVAITEGPFADFNGTVEEVLPDKGKVRVSVSLFGRPTSVELDYLQLRGY